MIEEINNLEGHLVVVVGGKTDTFISNHIRQAVNLNADKIIVTNTNADSALKVRGHITRCVGNPLNKNWASYNVRKNLINHELQNEEHLHRLFDYVRSKDELKGYLHSGKVLTIVAAKDREIGDDIHTTYAKIALENGSMVLAEKPATGSQKEELLNMIEGFPKEEYSTNLQMSLIKQNLPFHHQNAHIKRINWSTKGDKNTIVSDLAPHMFSLIPEHIIPSIVVEAYRKEDDVHKFYLWSDEGQIKLSIDAKDTGLRGFQIDNTTYLSEGTNIVPVANTEIFHIEQYSNNRQTSIDCGDMLQQSILRLVNANPLCPPKRTLESELFITKLKDSMH